MTYLTNLIGRLGKTFGIGTASTTAPAASDTGDGSGHIEDPAKPPSAPDAPTSTTSGH